MAAEVRMVLYEDDSVQVQYVDGSRLQLSPCGSEFLFEKAPSASAHPLEQSGRIHQRTHFVISTYREQLQRALEFRNSYATCPFLSESIIPSERKKGPWYWGTQDLSRWWLASRARLGGPPVDHRFARAGPVTSPLETLLLLCLAYRILLVACRALREGCIFIDITEVRWPSLNTDDGLISMQSGTVMISSLDGHAYLCLSKSQHEFTVHFLCKVSQKPESSRVLSEKNNQAQKDRLVEQTGKICTYGNLSRRKLKNKENELCCQTMKSTDPLEDCVDAAECQKGLPSGLKLTCLYTWVKQCWSVAACPEEWKYPLSLALRFHNKIRNQSETDTDVIQSSVLTSDVSEEKGKEISVLPRALLLSCPVPHLHRWNFCDSLLQEESDEEYTYPELVKVVWYKGVTYRLTHKNVNSLEIYPGDGSVFRSEGAYLGNFFTYYYSQEGSEEKEEKMYSVKNLPPDRPGSLFSVSSLIKQATKILQHCAKMRLSLSHNYRICCWKTAPGISDSIVLPLLLKESLIPSVGRILAYSDDKVHAMFLDGTTLTLNWNFGSFTKEKQVNQGLSLGWCKLTFPDGHDQLIQIEHPGPHERYVATVITWCRRLAQTSQRAVSAHPSPVHEENWSVASELEKIKKFNLLLENSGVLNQISKKKNKPTLYDYTPESSEILLEENEKNVSMALKKTSDILQDIDCLLSNSKK